MLKYRLRKLGRKKIIFWSTSILIFIISMASIIRYYAVTHAITPAANTSIVGNTVYINDLDADYYYYESLNFTEMTDKNNLPSGNNTNRYGLTSASTYRLIPVQINYNGNGGHITSGSQPSNYVYYKYYPVKNGKIDIELIDNPYTNRPSNKGFNGWYCAEIQGSVPCSSMVFDIDNDYYVRHLEIPVTNQTSLLVNLNASWVDARVLTDFSNTNTPANTFYVYGMTKAKNVLNLSTESITVDYEYYDNNDQFISQNNIYRLNTGSNGTVVESGNYLVNNNNPLRAVQLTSNYTCTSSCQYLTAMGYRTNPRNLANNASYDYDPSATYKKRGTSQVINGETVYNFADPTGTWHQPRIKERTNVTITQNNVPAGKNYQTIAQWAEDKSLSGYYYLEAYDSSNPNIYYDSTGRSCAKITCSGDRYRRLEGNDEKLSWAYEEVTATFNEPTVNPVVIRVPKFDIDNYYIFVTRDVNLISLGSGSYNLGNIISKFGSRPYTITSNAFGAKTNTYLTNNAFSAASDMVIENINFEGHLYAKSSDANTNGSAINSNGHNVKLGQNLGTYYNANVGNTNRVFMASHVLGSANKKFIIESGSYVWGSALPTASTTSGAQTKILLGSDYYRAAANNSDLLFQYLFAGTRFTSSTGKHNSDSLVPIADTIVKSGTYGNYVLNDNGNPSDGYVYGVYAGGLGTQNANSTGFYQLTIEGGRIYCINGGPSVPSSYTGNSLAIRIKGGTINNVVGGAGVTGTYGNRIVSVTGGQVYSSVSGGSNSSSSSGNNPGPLNADTLVYIGGNALIGGGTGLFDSEAGNVYGAGLGRTGNTNVTRGVVNNSHVVINGGVINNDVYGGGNYGSTGTQLSGNSRTKIDIHENAYIKGSVFGAANNAGAGTDGTSSGAGCGCTGPECISGTYYKVSGIVTSGSIVPGGVYHARGNSLPQVYRSNNNYTCTNQNGTCTMFEEVNSSSVYDSSVQYYSFRQTGSGYQIRYYMDAVSKPNTCIPTDVPVSNYRHNITINMDGGHVEENVYGGSNAKGTVYGDTNLFMSGGTVDGDVFGGGKGGVNGLTSTNASDSTVIMGVAYVEISGNHIATNVYGGSALGRVNGATSSSSNATMVRIKGGTVSDSVYGCGKGESGAQRPYTFGPSHVVMTGGTVGNVYGGNNASGTVYYSSDVQLLGGIITNNAFGGGNNVGHSTSTSITTNIKLDGTKVSGSVFGGSNNSGNNTRTNVTVNSGTVANVFGGNNLGGTVTETNVVVDGFTSANNDRISGDVFGGGNLASTTTSNVTIESGTLKNASDALRGVYGGGYSAATNTTHTLVKDGTMGYVFGGGYSANATLTKVVVKDGDIGSVYGGSNSSGIVTNSYVFISDGDIDSVFGGNNAGGSTSTSHVQIGGGDLGNVYGGGNAVYTGTTNVEVYDGEMENVFGGDNNVTSTGSTNTTNVYVYGGTVSDGVYGGSNQNGGVNRTNVNIEDRSQNDYCPQATTGTGVAIEQCYEAGDRSVNDVYGGNNLGGYTNVTNVKIKDDAEVNDVFGGGNNAKVLVSTDVRIYQGSAHHVYGGGNHSFVGDALVDAENAFDPATTGNAGTTRVYIADAEISGNVYGSGNSSFVYGNTYVYIGKKALDVLNADLPTNGKITNPVINIEGSVFGGSETNSEGETTWTFSYKGVIGNTNVYVDAGSEYNNTNVTIKVSLFGSGNNAATQGIAKIYISNLGTTSNIKSMASIQRADYVYLTDSVIELRGARDRAQPTTYMYGLARINAFYMLGSSASNGTILHMGAGAEYLGQDWAGGTVIEDNNNGYFSGTMVVPSGYADPTDLGYYNHTNFRPQTTDISTSGQVTNGRSNNKLFMYTNVVFSIANADAPDYQDQNTVGRKVEGMTYFGMYNKDGNTYKYGIYNTNLTHGQDITNVQNELSGMAYSFVYGKHNEYGLDDDYTQQIKHDGFYSHYKDEDDETKLKIAYVQAKPLDQKYYKWVLGEEPLDIEVMLQATKSSVASAQIETISLTELKEMVNGIEKDWQDAKMKILNVDVSGFKASSNVKTPWDAYLVDKTQIPAVATGSEVINGYTITDANRKFALSMGTSTSGWMDNYKTNFYDPGYSPAGGDNICGLDSVGECTGSDMYVYDSTRNSRSLSFWLYYSKNIDFDLYDGDLNDDIYEMPLGEVYIYTEFTNPHGDPTIAMTTVPVRIVVKVSLVDNLISKYGAAITPGKQYEVFDRASSTIISNKGSFSIYQMLSANLATEAEYQQNNELMTVKKLYPKGKTEGEKVYSDGYRYLKSDVALPVGTKITMLDLATNEEYYYTVDTLKTAVNGVYKYNLEDFRRMSTLTSTNMYDDNMEEENSTKYYKVIDGRQVAVEEFIFTVDFADVDPATWPTSTGHYLYLESAQDITIGNSTTSKVIMTPDGNPETQMSYSIQANSSTSITSTGEFVGVTPDNTGTVSIYKNDVNPVEVTTTLTTTNSVTPTEFDNYKLGAKITILQKDNNGNYNLVTNDLFGAVVTINGEQPYYPQVDGSIRLKLAGRVADVISDLDLDLSNSSLSFGEYILRIETFASYDGLYYGNYSPTVTELKFKLLNSEYGINATVPAVQVTHDVNNGEDKNGSREMVFTLTTLNGLANPNVKVHLERRDYNSNYDTSYTMVPLEGIAESMVVGSGSNILSSCYSYISGTECGRYNLIPSLNNSYAQQTFTVTMTLKDGPTGTDLGNMANAKWKSGTYRVVFEMYDANKYIGSVYEYLIIRSLNIDEEVEGS